MVDSVKPSWIEHVSAGQPDGGHSTTGRYSSCGGTGSGSVKRACDSCRRRKVKCDSTLPQCSNCRLSEIGCSYNIPPRKRGPRFGKAIDGHRSKSTRNHPFNLRKSSTVDDFGGTTEASPNSAQGSSGEAPDLSAEWPSTATSSTSKPDHHETESSQSSWTVGMEPSSTPETQNFDLPGQQPWSHHNNQFREVVKDSSFDLSSVQTGLIASLHTALPGDSIAMLISECIDLFVQYLFPIMPIVHEKILRNCMSLFEPNLGLNPRAGGQFDISVHRCFALITAVCAEAAFVLSSRIFRKGSLVAPHFLQASRQTLNLYQDRDIENPDSSSLVIRYLHSNCTHAAGQTRISWHVLGESIRLAQEMHLYDEQVLGNLNPIESQLQRNIFWQLYTGDKSAALLNDRPFSLHEFNIRKKITLSNKSSVGHSLLDSSRSQHSGLFESRLMAGFHLCQRLWSVASDLLLDLHLLYPRSTPLDSVVCPSEEQRSQIMDVYLQFLGIIDDMPSWLLELDRLQGMTTEDEAYQRSAFWVQRTNLEVTFQSLSLIIIQKFFDLNLSALVGISPEPIMMALKKTDIAREMLLTITKAPFESLQINGECCVEKIRQIGAALLEITQNTSNQQLSTRAQSTFSALLDILASLDSQASNSLYQP